MPPTDSIRAKAAELQLPLFSAALAQALDAADPLARLRQSFCIPRRRQHVSATPSSPVHPQSSAETNDAACKDASEEELVYLCGNSLGLLPKESKRLVDQEFDVWAGR